MTNPAQPPTDDSNDHRNLVEQLWRGRVQVRLRRDSRAAGWLTLQISRDGDDLVVEWEPLCGAPCSQEIPRGEMAAWLRKRREGQSLVTGDVEWLSDSVLRVRIEGLLYDSLPVEALPALLAVTLR